MDLEQTTIIVVLCNHMYRTSKVLLYSKRLDSCYCTKASTLQAIGGAWGGIQARTCNTFEKINT